jgi:hypothetical protein
MYGCKGFENEAKPSCTVIDAVGSVERNREEFTETVEAGDTSPGQLGVRDVVISKGVTNIEGFDIDATAKAEKEFVGGRRLFRNTSLRKFKEWFRGRGIRHVRRRDGEGRGRGRGLVRHYGKMNGLESVCNDEQGGSARKTRRSP